jgi:hypothetical protein
MRKAEKDPFLGGDAAFWGRYGFRTGRKIRRGRGIGNAGVSKILGHWQLLLSSPNTLLKR